MPARSLPSSNTARTSSDSRSSSAAGSSSTARSSSTVRSSSTIRSFPRAGRVRVLAATTVPLAAALLLAGCSGASTASTETAPANADTGSSGYPLTIDNCGTDVTF